MKRTTILLAFLLLSISGWSQMSLDELERESFHPSCIPLDLQARDMVPCSARAKEIKTRSIDLCGEWALENINKDKWDVKVPCIVPGSIHKALYLAGVIPNPLVGQNDSIAARCSYQPWKLTRRFHYDGLMSDPLLSFAGIANKCRVILNGECIGEHEGMFGGPDIKLKGKLLKGENVLEVELDAIPFAAPRKNYVMENQSWRSTVVINCVYGWHYSRIPSLGIWDGVRIEDDQNNGIKNPFVLTRSTDGKMRLLFSTQCPTPEDELLLSVSCNGKVQSFKGTLDKTLQTQVFDFKISDPQLWWPNGYGDHPIYKAVLCLRKGNRITCSKTFDFGVRTVSMSPLPGGPYPDKYNWTFVINGKPIFIKGTGWCTMDVLLDFDKVRYRRFLNMAARQNCQMVRAWGGGMPESDDFYQLCDSLGLMVFQEWPTAWNSHVEQPYALLEETVVRNTLRIRNHPSPVMWGGGNESNKPFGAAIDMMGRLSVELDGTRPFHRSETWGGSKHSYFCWWNNRQHLNFNLNYEAPFIGEFGIPSIPVRETVDQYLDGDDSSFTHHMPKFGKDKELDRMKQYAGYFMETDNLDDFIFGSQLAQGEGLRHTLERARTRWPECTGALTYKLNDNYPALSWASVDYYGRTKLAHWFTKAAFEPTTTVLLFDRTNLDCQRVSIPYFFLDDRGSCTNRRMSARLSVYDDKFNHVLDTTICFIPQNTVVHIADIELTRKQTAYPMMWFVTDLLDDEGHTVARNWYFSNYETERGRIKTCWKTKIDVDVNGDELTLKNVGKNPAPGVYVEVPEYSDKVEISDNWLWINPGETVTIKVSPCINPRITGLNLR